MSRRRSLASLRPKHHVAVFSVFVAGYFLLGLAGLQLQSAQTGVTPLWPASGFAFAMAYWFGWGHALAIIPAMLSVGAVVGVPVGAGLASATGSIVEVVIPVWLLRRSGFDPTMRNLRDVWLFIGLGPLLGPVFSASVGTIAFHLFADSSFDPVGLWLMWWLGNSIGLLTLGGLGLVWVARHPRDLSGRPMLALVLGVGAVVTITLVGMLHIDSLSSPLVLYLLIPVFVLIAQRGEQMPVLLLGVSAVATMLMSTLMLPAESLILQDLGIPYLNASLLWVVTFTGMVIGCARHEVRSREEASWLANHDPLTRLLNRRAFMTFLDAALSRARETSEPWVLLYLDLDRFKDLNDAEGHRAGDRVLCEVAQLLVGEVRAVDHVARIGGDEYAILLEDCALLDACAIAENIRAGIERYEYSGERGPHRVEASIGLAQLEARYDSPEDALHDVDSACYAAKRGGRNRVWISSGDDAKVVP